MAKGHENLIPLNKRSKEAQRKIQSMGGKEFIGEKDRRKPEQSKTLLQLVSEGYHLHIRGHWGDGQIIPGTPSKCRTWWNDPDNFTLIDLMTLNKFLLTNQK
jgi:hypothetical protein